MGKRTPADRRTDRQTDRQLDGQADSQAGRQADCMVILRSYIPSRHALHTSTDRSVHIWLRLPSVRRAS